MKNLMLITFALLISFQIDVLSQPCLPEGITFNTQEEIDNFQINYPGCTEIEGDVTIYGLENDIFNLDSLNVLTAFGGNLEIKYCDSLTNLTGLDNLISIGGYLLIYNNDGLINLSGLNNVSSLGGDLRIDRNNALTSLSGLENLNADSIGNLTISYNNSLSTCEGVYDKLH